MSISESAVGRRHAFEWSTYSVSRARKEPLLRFITIALEMRGCSIVYSSEANLAPFYVVFETPAGDRRAAKSKDRRAYELGLVGHRPFRPAVHETCGVFGYAVLASSAARSGCFLVCLSPWISWTWDS